MSNIIVDYNAPIQDGTEVVFRSPVDCSQVTGLKVNYNGGSQEFMFADAHGNNVGDIDHLFAENVVVKVILDVTTGMAFVQNADTNAYLEGRFSELEQMIGAGGGGGASSGIINEASGNPIVLTDSANGALKVLNLYGRTTQNGTPTLDAPVALENAGSDGDVTVAVLGKNLLDYRKSIPRRDDQTVEIDESINGVYWTGTYYFYVPLDAIIPKGTTVMFSCKSESVDPENSNYVGSFEACYTDGTTGYMTIGYPLTLSKDANRIAVRRDSSSVANTIKVWDMQLEIGSTITEYEPYKEPQTITVPTPNGLPGIGDFCDEIDFARGVYVKRIKTLVLDGSENWRDYSSSNFRLYISDLVDCKTKNNADNYPVYSNTFAWGGYCSQNLPVGIGLSEARYIYLRFDSVGVTITTTNELKSWLASKKAEGNPVIVQYILEEPITTELTAEQLEAYANSKLQSHKPITTITCDADMKVEYVADTKNFIINEIKKATAELAATLTALTGV